MSCSQVEPSQDSEKNQQLKEKEVPNPFLSRWTDYFETPEPTNFSDSDHVHKLITVLHQEFQNYKQNQLVKIKQYQLFSECFIDIQHLLNSLKLTNIEEFVFEPQMWISSIGIALDEILNSRIVVRIFNLKNETVIRQLKSHDIGHFVSVRGVILSVSSAKILVLKTKFTCSSCFESQWVSMVDGIYHPPKMCINYQCKVHNFNLDRNQIITTLYQRIKIQEIDTNENQYQNVGRQALTIEVEVRDNLVQKYISGDFVLVNGILKTEQDEQKGKQFNGIFTKYILASSIFELSNQFQENQNEDQQQFSQEELNKVNKIAEKGLLFYTLINSFCPTIYGNELVKAGVLLCMTGGSKMKFDCRSNCHCLMIGDPGQGKSQLLKFASLIAPKAIYVSGTGTSSCGLTCSVNKKDEDGTSIDAGALVLADNGTCCIDEFDKMPNEHSALLEAMEQQTVSLAKSGILCQFQARTSIIATANPSQGHYQKNKTFIDNLKIQNSILSRFDLIFLLLDEPDPQRDKKLAEHILLLHNNKKRTQTQFEKTGLSQQCNEPFQDRLVYKSLRERLYNQCQQINTIFSVQLIKKILAHIKINVNPQLSQDASKLIQDYYIKLRQQTLIASASLPITTRQLESLIRLAQARARLDLRDLVVTEDAQFIIQLVEESKFECFMDYQDITSQRRNKPLVDKSNVSSLSKPKQTQFFLEALSQLTKQNHVQQNIQRVTQSNQITISQIKEQAKKINLQVGDFNEFLEKLNLQGYLIQIEIGKYELKYNQ